MKYLIRVVALAGTAILTGCLGGTATEFPHQEDICTTNTNREARRVQSAQNFPQPVVDRMLVNGMQVWVAGQTQAPTINAGDEIELQGSGFGRGTRIDFSKIMVGNARVLETNLRMFEQTMDLVAQVHFELPNVRSRWRRDIIEWRDHTVRFTVPLHASSGPIRLQVQKRTGANESMLRPGQLHNVIDGQTYRIQDPSFNHRCDVVSQLSEETRSIIPIEVNVNNPAFNDMEQLGRELFWSYDYNIGIAHDIRNLEWEAIMDYRAIDPFTRQAADPRLLFGAYKTIRGQVPDEAIDDVFFDEYPQPTPIPGLLSVGPQRTDGNTRNTGWVGYRYAESNHPFKGNGSWIGFNCASCHSYQITYEDSPGNTVTEVFPGLPNPEWSMKWAVLGTNGGATTTRFDGIDASEPTPAWASGGEQIDKTSLVYHMPAGTGEHNLIRGSNEGSLTDNDYNFSPITIPNVTNHLPIRRSLSHTESYVGFEGSYIHSEEPDGATGSMNREGLQALTAYMSVLDQDDDKLINLGMYRWLAGNGQLAAQTGDSSLGEGEFLQAGGWQAYPGIQAVVAEGKAAYDRDCGSCHNDDLGANTNERMFRLDEVGRFFAPTIYHKEQQSIRATFLRNMYWVTSRGLLSDGHVRNLEDLVDPARCTEGSPLYNQYYTLHSPVRPAAGTPDAPLAFPDLNRRGDVFRVTRMDDPWAWWPFGEIVTTELKRNRFVERHKYFVTVPWDDDYYYWDYQKMRAEYGPYEMGTDAPIGLPATPHPWCAADTADISPLVQYVLTL